MSVQEIRNNIKSKLESLDIAKVQDYRRHTVDWDEVAEFFKKNGRINGAIISWRDMTPTKEASGSIAIRRQHTFRIDWMYSLRDDTGSQKTFENLVEDALDEFDKEQDLPNAKARWFEPARLVGITEGMFSGVLCHRAEIILSYEELIGFA